MNLKLRFAMMFAITVAVILLLSSIAIYYFYSSNRKNEYQSKLKSEGMLAFDAFINKDTSQNSLSIWGDISLLEKKIIILSEERKTLHSFPDAVSIKVSTKTLLNIKQQKEYYYKVGNREFIGIYLDQEKIYIVSSAIDKDGLKKLIKLRFILLAVFLTSVFITASLSYFFVTSALQPLSKLTFQIQQTTEKNLWQQVDEGNGKGEIALIAANYNAMLLRLKKAFELQKNFIHHASHELRTPLTVMYASTEAALSKKLSEDEYKAVLTSLKEDQNNLIELTNALLLLSQFEKLQNFQNWQNQRIDELIYDAVGYCKKIFPGNIIDFSFESRLTRLKFPLKWRKVHFYRCLWQISYFRGRRH